MTPLIAVIDVGKSNAKLSFVDARSGLTIWSIKRVDEIVCAAGLRQLDIVAIEHWLLDALKSAPDRDRLAAIVPRAHGAAAVLVDDQGEIVVAPDYEDPAFGLVDEDYERARNAFEDTYSPSLPLGLRLGRQWHSDIAVVCFGEGPQRAVALPPAVEPLVLAGLDEYRRAWRERLPEATAGAMGVGHRPIVCESRR